MRPIASVLAPCAAAIVAARGPLLTRTLDREARNVRFRIDLRNVDSEWIRLFHGYISGATARAVEFSLSVEQVKYICLLPCYYCGARESNLAIPPKRGHRSRTPLKYNGIDQVLACGGYHPGNVLPCCCFCNRAKGSLDLEKFVVWINRVFGRHLTADSVRKPAALAKN